MQRTHTNKDPLIYTTTSPHTHVFQLAVLTTVTLASTSNALPDDGVTAPKHVGALLMSILMYILKFFKDKPLVHQLVNKKLS